MFKQIVNRKGWTFTEIGNRWGLSERQMSRVANSGHQRDIDAANGLPDQRDDNASELARYLNISDDQLDELNLELLENTGSSGETVYSYYFYVPMDVPAEILELTGWVPGQMIDGIPINVFDRSEDHPDDE